MTACVHMLVFALGKAKMVRLLADRFSRDQKILLSVMFDIIKHDGKL